MPFNIHNWFHKNNIIGRTILINIYEVKTIWEVDIWMEGCTRYMVELLPPDGIIYVVDIFEGSKAEKGNQLGSLTSTLYD
jgi:hypothetical protein